MATVVAERRTQDGRDTTEAVQKGARLSARLRAKRPLPATRREADDLFAPSPRIAQQPATIPRIARLMRLGVLPQLTNAEAHQLILDALYPCDPGATEERDTPSPTA